MTISRVAVLSWRLLTGPERRRVALLAVGMVVNGVLQTFSLAMLIPFVGLMLNPESVKPGGRFEIFSRFFGDQVSETLLVFCAFGLLAAIAIKDLFEFGYNYVLNRLAARVERRISTDLLTRCMEAPYEWFFSRNTGTLTNAVMSDVIVWGRTGLKSMLALASSAILLISVLGLLVSVNPLFGLGIAALAAIVTISISRLIKPYVSRLAATKHDANDEAIRIINHAFGGFKDIKVNGRERFFVKQYSRWQGHFSDSNARLSTIQPVPNYAIELLIALILVGVGLMVSANPGLRAEMTSVLALYGVAVVRLIPVFNQVSGIVNQIHMAIPAIENITRTNAELLAFERQDGLAVETENLGTLQTVSLENVSYSYPNAERRALNGLSILIERGMRVGVVGRSGGGKTTLVDILTGLLAPTAGRVAVNGVTLGRGNVRSWRTQLGYVPQHPFMADDSIRFNVALESDPQKIDDDRVLAALETANLGELLRSELVEGLDTSLGERGVRLSGGQRQRVAIARALYRDPSFLILDEATSALDSHSEREISDALARISRDKTIVIVAHRLSTVRDCDCILVLEKGAIVGFDNHDNLIRTCPLYQRFVQLGDLSGGAIDDEGAAPNPFANPIINIERDRLSDEHAC